MLLQTFEIVAHGSTNPVTNFTGMEFDKSKMGKLSQFGARQMYLRGLQMRKHLMSEKNLLKPFHSPDEISVRSLSN